MRLTFLPLVLIIQLVLLIIGIILLPVLPQFVHANTITPSPTKAQLIPALHRQFKVGLQIGHFHSQDFPPELASLRNNHGATYEGIQEVNINETIATLSAKLLEEKGIHVDILPATIPPHYHADLFLAIHADKDPTHDYSGFKVAYPWHNISDTGPALVSILEKSYQLSTHMPLDSHITRNMTEYYAFNYERFQHSIDPRTPAAIIETGFIPNANDEKIIVDHPEKAAEGIANGIIKFLTTLPTTNG